MISAQSQSLRRLGGVVVIASGLFLAILLALGCGSTTHDPLRVVALLLGQGTGQELDALYGVRLPRVLVGIGAGASLALAGLLLQAATRNPLADSGLLGIQAGSGLALAALLASYPSRGMAPPWLLPLAATGGGLAVAALVLALAWRPGGVPPLRLVLVGIAIAACASAATLTLTLAVDPAQLRFFVAWQAGTLSGRDMSAAAQILPVALLGAVAAWLAAPRLELLALDDETAIGLGLAPDRARSATVAAAAVLTAAVVPVAGALGFVGLLAPALARAVVGPGLRWQVPAVAIGGAAIVVAADAVARVVAAPIELPTGLLVALVGGPMLLIAMCRWSRS
jgi:iron complex transport system permease protein